MSDDVALVQVSAIEEARAGLAGVLRPTPTEPTDTLSRLCGREILLKTEHRQRTGSFKIRGAYHLLSHLPPEEDLVVAASAGNHAQGVALAAALLGKRSVIFMPAAAPIPKVQATRAYGAEIRLGHVLVDDCITEAKAWAAEHGARFVPPFDDPAIIAGQGTIGLELAEEAPHAGVVLVPVGGGGLLAGVAVALRARRPGVRIIGVEAAGAASMRASLDAFEPTGFHPIRTIADGIAIKSPSPLTLAHAHALVDDVISVTDHEIATALLLLLERSKQMVEPSGAVGLAALLAGRVPGNDPAVAILSGGNVDPLMLTHLIEHGLTAVGRYLRLRIVVADRPGALSAIVRSVAETGLNILEIDHHRQGVRVGVDEVELTLTLETRDPAHRLEVLDRLRAAGYQVEQL
ncbi:MAG: threonine ammonia-lyase [Acidimicrobiales bacterium]|nr:threonine ammonia-lyase [Acidimicrobiales bacterium]